MMLQSILKPSVDGTGALLKKLWVNEKEFLLPKVQEAGSHI